MKVGVFDSGVGGILVSKNLLERFDMEILCLCDDVFFPFNDLDKEKILERVSFACDFFEKEGCDQIVIACHTASILAKKNFFEREKVHYIADFMVEKFVSINKFKKLALIGTKHTIESNYYTEILAQKAERIVLLKTPKLATLAERIFYRREYCIEELYCYLEEESLRGIDGIGLCCTHYSIFREDIGNFFKEGVMVIDSYIGDFFFKFSSKKIKKKLSIVYSSSL